MADNNGGTRLDLLTKATNDIARKIGEMDPPMIRCALSASKNFTR